MIRRAPLLALLTALCLFALPASSPAAPRSFASRFELDAGQGYHLAVVGRGDTVTVEVGRPRSLHQGALPPDRPTSQSLTAYAVRGTVTRRRITASFGKLGRIDVRFRPLGKPVMLPAKHHCLGADHFTMQRGLFVGSIRFEGEHHYVAVRTHRAAGAERSPQRLICFSGRSRASAGERGRPVSSVGATGSRGSLSASWRHAVASTELYANANPRRALTIAVVEESLGRMAEFHFGLAVSHPQVFAVDNALTRATLAPPAPFHGTGTYEAGPDGSKSWTGSLSVSFPGAPHWPLTGEQFKVSLGAGL
jgi:hypothetical protein